MRKRVSFFNLKRGKLRQSWNKYNLYNISKFTKDISLFKTLFQRQWHSKAATRAYHGETLREKQWRRQFNPTLRSVLPMNPIYLARTDGTEQSAGRGSGLDIRPGSQQKKDVRVETPYTTMVYAALERRLDVAVHRSMFASSTRQARQFVIHGYVKVNGRKMIYPSYQLNPGDMFQVDPDKVMYATGAPKDASDRQRARKDRKMARATRSAGTAEAEASEEAEASAQSAEQAPEDTAKLLQAIADKAKDLVSEKGKVMSASRKRNLRMLQRMVRKAMSKTGRNRPLEEAVDEQMLQLIDKLNVTELSGQIVGGDVSESPTQGSAQASAENAAESGSAAPKQWMSNSQKSELRKALQQLKDNPIDSSKPYATPWRPRDFLSPFAFIPRYLEVHHKICSAIYLRHPVARPGVSEIPSPFKNASTDLAFSWYLRKR